MLIAAALYAGATHNLNIVGVIIAAIAGAIIGDNIGSLSISSPPWRNCGACVMLTVGIALLRPPLLPVPRPSVPRQLFVPDATPIDVFIPGGGISFTVPKNASGVFKLDTPVP